MPQTYAVQWPKFVGFELEDAKTRLLKVAMRVPIVISGKMQS